jgi:hypothetical protein
MGFGGAAPKVFRSVSAGQASERQRGAWRWGLGAQPPKVLRRVSAGA